jgi:class 3 adenylate cyclase
MSVLDRQKPIAVVYADMIGYSRLIGLDDAGTLQRLRMLRNEVIDPTINQHGGRIVQAGGDSLPNRRGAGGAAEGDGTFTPGV